jgi:hypothetical protein
MDQDRRPAIAEGDGQESRFVIWDPRALRPVTRSLAVLAAVFAVLVGLHVHGFSISAWHSFLDGSPPKEVVLGAPRLIRSDDWVVHLPLAFAQAAHHPPFPLVNTLIGSGQSALLPIELPVWHPLALFRPTLWGFFLGNDAGMAWMWWSRVLGLAALWFAVLRVVSRGRRDLAAAGVAILLASPLFQFWSFNAAPHVAALGATVLATLSLLRATRPAAIWTSGAALGAAGAWFALATYPPYQVTLAWLYPVLVLGVWLEDPDRGAVRRHGGTRLLAMAVAGLFVLGVLGVFFLEARDAIETMRGTVYPGLRTSSGGDRPLWTLVTANFATGWWASSGWGPLVNVSEAASPWLLAPMPTLLWLLRAARERSHLDRLALLLLVYQAVLVVYAVLGFPEWLAGATGWSFVPGARCLIGIGLADVALLLRWLACAPPAIGTERWLALGLTGVWAGLLGLLSIPLAQTLPEARTGVLFALAAANGVLVFLALTSRRRSLAPWLLAAASFATTAWFNPLVIGGSTYLTDNPLSQRILEIDQKTPGRSTWVTFGIQAEANLFRAIGVRSVNGLQPVPQLSLWERVDPEGRGRVIYNRYANVVFAVGWPSEPVFRRCSRDCVVVYINPTSPALRELGVTHALFVGNEVDRRNFERHSHFEWIDSVGQSHLYRVPPLAPEPSGSLGAPRGTNEQLSEASPLSGCSKRCGEIACPTQACVAWR